ncbi:hypothetical protein CRUP_014654 [Coryphaenoides rupestris]|nr:hypothetical protein CRUP_014654 [Coryphaenoides rupestris]
MTVGSRSTNTALGTCFPAPVSLKKVLKESSPPPMLLSLGIWPSGWMPCSRQYSSQQALPIWAPAWPTWTEMHSRWAGRSCLRRTCSSGFSEANTSTMSPVFSSSSSPSQEQPSADQEKQEEETQLHRHHPYAQESHGGWGDEDRNDGGDGGGGVEAPQSWDDTEGVHYEGARVDDPSYARPGRDDDGPERIGAKQEGSR